MSSGAILLPVVSGSGGAVTWKDPVTSVADLPGSGNVVGDARVVTDNNAVFIWGSDNAWHADGGGAAWTPLSTTANKLTWESDVLVTASGGAAVAWEDQASGETLLTLGAPPTIVANQLNGLPVLRFDGSTQALSGGVTAYNDDSRAFSIYLVVKPAAFSGTQYFIPIYLPNTGGSGKSIWILLTNDPATSEVSWANSNVSANINSGAIGLSSSNFQVIRIFYNGQGASNINAYTFSIVTSAMGVSLNSAAEVSGTAHICFGRRFISNDAYFKGDLAAFYYFNTDNTANGVDALMSTYLMGKYGIS